MWSRVLPITFTALGLVTLVGGVLLGPLLAMGLGHAPAIGAGLAVLAALLVYAHRPNLRAALARLREERPSSG